MDFAAVDIPSIGAGALVAIVCLSIFRGWLVPRRVMVDAITAKDAVIAGCVKTGDDWREVALSKDETIKTLADQLDEAMEMARTSQAIVNALPRVAANG